MSLRRDRHEPPADIVVELDDPAELFYVDQSTLLDGGRRIDTGIDEIVERLLAQKRLSTDQHIVVDIAKECSDEQAANLVAAVRRYCDGAVLRANRQHGLIWRQGMRSLVSGSLLFVLGIGLSFLFNRPFVGEFAIDLFGNGVFLVVAWVGLWYPLDVLFIAREQAKREAKVVDMMQAMPIDVRSGSGSHPVAAPPRSPSGSREGSRPVRLRGSRVRLRGAPATGTPGAN